MAILLTVLCFLKLVTVVTAAIPSFIVAQQYIRTPESTAPGTELKRFSVTDSDTGDSISVFPDDTTTADYINITQTHGNNITVHMWLAKKLDADRGNSSVNLKFAATDTLQGNKVNLILTLYILDVNDERPEFKNEPYRLSIEEASIQDSRLDKNHGTGEVYHHVSAVDLDSGNAGYVTYSMQPDSQSDTTAREYNETFRMSNTTGNVTLLKPLDYERNTYYQFKVTAQDMAPPYHKVYTSLIIRVLDIQDTRPFFTGIPYRTEILENLPIGTSVMSVSATDGDHGVSNRVDFRIKDGDCSSYFNISSDGLIVTTQAIDRDNGEIKNKSGVCSFPVEAYEINGTETQYGNTTTTTNVTVMISDANDNSPQFENDTIYMAEIQENTPKNVPITFKTPDSMTVYDKDQGENSRMKITLSTSDFTVEPEEVRNYGSLLIRVANKTVLDFEERQNISFQITATEVTNTSHVATATVFLKLIDMNDNNPMFDNKSYYFTIDENLHNATTVGNILATDRDSGNFGTISFFLSGGNDRFVIGSQNGVIQTNCNSSLLDRETLDVYYVTITATDGGGRSNATSVVIHLKDINDNNPRFLRQLYTVSISENNNYTTPIITLTATDDDEAKTVNSEVIYSIKSVSEPTVNLTIDGTGAVYLNSAVDYEKLENKAGGVYVVIEAQDKGTPALNSTVTLTIDVQDKNDNPPVFNQTYFNGSVFENEKSEVDNHTNVVQVFATDADRTTRNNRFDYFIISGSYEKFSVNSSTGEVYIKPNVELDRETLDFYNITMNAIDHGSPPLTGTAFVLVTVKDVNDVAPSFNESSYSFKAKENQNLSNAFNCSAYDVDENHNLSFSMTVREAKSETGQDVNSSLVQGYFSINDSTGQVSVSSSADREVAEEIRLRVTVRDLNAYGPNPQIATAPLTVTLLDINDNSPQFDDRNYTFTVPENAIDGSVITIIHATDKDVNRTITYKLEPGPDPTSSFKIDNKTGELRKSGPLDREKNTSVEITITAKDSGKPDSLNSTRNILIVILDFNDNAPVFEAHNTSYEVREDVHNGTEITVITATDADTGKNSYVTYSFIDGTSPDFKINQTSGAISVAGTLNREAISRYTLIIIARDNPEQKSEQKSSQTTIYINVTDINDNAPSFTPASYYASVRENVNLNSLIVAVTASDVDEPGSNNSKIHYEVKAGNEQSLFKIDSRTGEIYNNASLEDHVGNYTLTVIAKDYGYPQLNGSAIVNIEVTDVNLNNPVLVNLPSGATVKTFECARINSTVHQFIATDADHGRNAELNYVISLTESNASVANFWIEEDTGLLRIKKNLTDMGGETFKLQLVVSDRGDPVLSSIPYIFTVEVLDVNDHPPEFRRKNYNMSVLENHINTTVGTVTAVDKDKNSVSCYSISESLWSNYFYIGNTSGTITTVKELDHENVTNILLTVTVTDCSAPENKSEVCDNYTTSTSTGHKQTTVDVHVVDMDDNPPVFAKKEIPVGMRRNVEQGSFLSLQLKEGSYVTDKDTAKNGRNKWTFKNNGEVRRGPGFEGNVNGGDGIRQCDDNITHLFCISRNGSITNNFWFNEDMSGFFLVPIMVIDGAGNDTASVKIYLIADSQVLLMTIYGRKADVADNQKEILQLFSNITGHEFVYDDIADHKTDSGTVDSLRTDLFFHVVEPHTNRILPAVEAQRLVDEFSSLLVLARERYKITQIVTSIRPAAATDNSARTIYILVAAVVVLVLTLCIIIYLFCSSTSRYRRKLKAATISTIDRDMEMNETRMEIPGSNQYSKQNNPLLNATEQKLPEYDSLSLSSENSLDANEVDAAQPDTVYDTMEEKEMTMDLYNDDEFVAIPEEDALSAVLRRHELQRSTETLDQRSLVDSEDGLVKMNGDVSHEKVTLHGFENHAYDNLEHSEI